MTILGFGIIAYYTLRNTAISNEIINGGKFYLGAGLFEIGAAFIMMFGHYQSGKDKTLKNKLANMHALVFGFMLMIIGGFIYASAHMTGVGTAIYYISVILGIIAIIGLGGVITDYQKSRHNN